MILPKQSLLFSLSLLSFFNSLLSNPQVDEINFQMGPSSGGNEIVIKGNGFSHTENVTFGNIKTDQFKIISDNMLIVTAPEGLPGTIELTVEADHNTSPITKTNRYTYQGNWFICTSNGLPENNFLFIDESTHICGPTISLNGSPNEIVLNNEASKGYLANFANNTVSVLDMNTKNIISTLEVGTNPINLAITPDGKSIYVVNSGSNDVSCIDVATNTVDPNVISVGHNPLSIAITPDGKKAYIVNSFSDSISVIDLNTKATNEILLDSSSLPSHIAISPDGLKGYITCIGANKVEVIKIPSDTLDRPIAFNDLQPSYIAITPNGHKAYVSNFNSEFVVAVDLTTYALNSISVGTTPSHIAITPDSKVAYVVGTEASVLIPIDVINDRVGSPISAEMFSHAIAISPDQSPIASFICLQSKNSLEVTFDASNSFSPVGSIVKYDWNFGDGNTLSSKSPYASHKFVGTGNYLVTLTVTNSAGTSTQQVYSSRMASLNGGSLASQSQLVAVTQIIPVTIATKPNPPAQVTVPQKAPTPHSTPTPKNNITPQNNTTPKNNPAPKQLPPLAPASGPSNLLGNPKPTFHEVMSASTPQNKQKVSKKKRKNKIGSKHSSGKKMKSKNKKSRRSINK